MIHAQQISAILETYSSGELIGDDQKEEDLRNIIYRLANPDLEGEVTPDICKHLIRRLS